MFSLVSISIQYQFCLSVSNKVSLLGNLMKVSWSSICETVLNNTQHYPFTSCLIFHLMSFVLSSFFIWLCVYFKNTTSLSWKEGKEEIVVVNVNWIAGGKLSRKKGLNQTKVLPPNSKENPRDWIFALSLSFSGKTHIPKVILFQSALVDLNWRA